MVLKYYINYLKIKIVCMYLYISQNLIVCMYLYIAQNLMKNMDNDIYISHLSKCSLVIGNSSSGIRETCVFEKPSISLCNRQKNRSIDKKVTFL